MRQLLWIIAAMMVLGAVVPGCDDVPRYDGRLTAADSLIHDHADSALTMLEALTPTDLATEGDRAYHDLLLTQARYKCYKPATTDSTINRALAYYRAHPNEREKLTRAYIYKGTVMEELGHPDSAMFYYKQAESVASSDDYFNLGYIKLRTAELYQGQISQDSTAIASASDAIRIFKSLNDTNYLIVSYTALGAIYGVISPDSAEGCLRTAIQLAKSYNPSMQYTPMSKLAGLCLYHMKDFRACNKLAMEVFKNGIAFCAENQFYYYALFSFLEMKMLDSAKYIMGVIPQPETKIDSMNYFNAVAQISNYENNQGSYAVNISVSKEMKADIVYQARTNDLNKVYLEYEKQCEESVGKQLKNENIALFVIVWLILGFLLIIMKKFWRFYKKNADRQRILDETNKHLKSELMRFQKELDENRNSKDISTLVGYRLSAMKDFFNLVRVKTDDAKRIRRIIPLSALLKSMNDKNEILDINLPDSFWEKMKRSVDGEFMGLATFMEQNYPQLSEQELRIFNLMAAGISPQIIMLCMHFSSAGSVSNYKKRILKEKMGYDVKLEEFIRMYLRGEIK